MNYTTQLVAIALGVATIASAAIPASALPNKNIPAQFHPGPVMQPVNAPIKVKLPPVVLQPKKPPIVQLPPPPVKLPPVVQLPHPIDNICPLNKFKCPPGPIPSPGKPPGGGPIVIVTPPVEVAVPVAVPVGVPQRIGGGGVAYAAPARPQAAAQCSAAVTTPELAAGIDQLLPTAQLADADKAQVTDMRQTIGVLAQVGKIAAARDVEEVAMKILGYRKAMLGCGDAFDWEPIVATTAAVQQK